MTWDELVKVLQPRSIRRRAQRRSPLSGWSAPALGIHHSDSNLRSRDPQKQASACTSCRAVCRRRQGASTRRDGTASEGGPTGWDGDGGDRVLTWYAEVATPKTKPSGKSARVTSGSCPVLPIATAGGLSGGVAGSEGLSDLDAAWRSRWVALASGWGESGGARPTVRALGEEAATGRVRTRARGPGGSRVVHAKRRLCSSSSSREREPREAVTPGGPSPRRARWGRTGEEEGAWDLEAERPRSIYKRRRQGRMSPLDNDRTVKDFLATWTHLGAGFLATLIIRKFFRMRYFTDAT
jgi:hypothetical protein